MFKNPQSCYIFHPTTVFQFQIRWYWNVFASPHAFRYEARWLANPYRYKKNNVSLIWAWFSPCVHFWSSVSYRLNSLKTTNRIHFGLIFNSIKSYFVSFHSPHTRLTSLGRNSFEVLQSTCPHNSIHLSLILLNLLNQRQIYQSWYSDFSSSQVIVPFSIDLMSIPLTLSRRTSFHNIHLRTGTTIEYHRQQAWWSSWWILSLFDISFAFSFELVCQISPRVTITRGTQPSPIDLDSCDWLFQ